MKKPDIKTLDDFNSRLQDMNPNLEAVSQYINRKTPIDVICKKCGHLMTHRTPFEWLYNGAKCYYCDNLPYNSKIESYKTYVERRSNGEITPLSNYHGANARMKYRCNKHDKEFFQYHSELFRTDRISGGALCEVCKGRKIAYKINDPNKLTIEAQKLAPNLEFERKFVSVTDVVTCTCRICKHKFPTSIHRIRKRRKSNVYCPKCNKCIYPDYQEELNSKNSDLLVVSEYKGRYANVDIQCKACGKVMTHKTARDWLKEPKCYYCSDQAYNPAVEKYNDYVERKTNGAYSVETDEWCATRQEDSEKLKSFVPPVEQSADGILMPPYSSSHGIQQESSSEASAVYVPRCSSEYKTLLR